MWRKLALREIKSLCLSTFSLFLFLFTIQSYQFQLVSHGHADILDCDTVRMESACYSGTSHPKLLHHLTGSSSSRRGPSSLGKKCTDRGYFSWCLDCSTCL